MKRCNDRRFRPPGAVPALLCAWVLSLCSATAVGQQLQRRAQTALNDEPSVERVQEAALTAAGYDRDDLDKWSGRARLSHALPDVEGRMAWLDQRDLQARYREDLESSEDGSLFRDRADNDFYDDARLRSVYQIDLEWDLGGLVYDRSEVTIAREVRMRRQSRTRLLEDVSEAYHKRRQFLLEWHLTPESEWRERLELRMEVDHYTALIDAMTGGWYSRALDEESEERAR
ncbi:MAG: hypothetical protein ACOCV2_12910 [Persicimonas sp.]